MYSVIVFLILVLAKSVASKCVVDEDLGSTTVPAPLNVFPYTVRVEIDEDLANDFSLSSVDISMGSGSSFTLSAIASYDDTEIPSVGISSSTDLPTKTVTVSVGSSTFSDANIGKHLSLVASVVCASPISLKAKVPLLTLALWGSVNSQTEEACTQNVAVTVVLPLGSGATENAGSTSTLKIYTINAVNVTSSPTNAPVTSRPTLLPTTASPTVKPSQSPISSVSTTHEPTLAPTLAPTYEPSVSPTDSQGSTNAPIGGPQATNAPVAGMQFTNSPTNAGPQLTNAPAGGPQLTSAPNTDPQSTLAPVPGGVGSTLAPTTGGTQTTTPAPIGGQTEQPTFEPSMGPTEEPTFEPSLAPTYSPIVPPEALLYVGANDFDIVNNDANATCNAAKPTSGIVTCNKNKKATPFIVENYWLYLSSKYNVIPISTWGHPLYIRAQDGTPLCQWSTLFRGSSWFNCYTDFKSALGVDHYYTGSEASGWQGKHCDYWTNSSATYNYGTANSTAVNTLISDGTRKCDDFTGMSLLCICESDVDEESLPASTFPTKSPTNKPFIPLPHEYEGDPYGEYGPGGPFGEYGPGGPFEP